MDEQQLLKQLQYLALADVWPGGERVFPNTSVIVTAAPEQKALEHLRTPWLLIRPGTGDPDDQTPTLISQSVDTVIGVKVPGDALGQNTLLGANKATPASSLGRGLLEIQRRLFVIMGQLTSKNGIRIKSVAKGPASAEWLESGYQAQRGYRWQAYINQEPGFQPPIDFRASGSVNLAWTNPDRWDFVEVVLRRVAGSVPVSDPTQGTPISLSSPNAESHADNPGVGVWSYSLFAGYDMDEDGITDEWSKPATATVTVA